MGDTLAAWTARQVRGAPLTSREAFELVEWFSNAAHDEESFKGMEWILPKFSLAAKYLRACGKRLMEEEGKACSPATTAAKS